MTDVPAPESVRRVLLVTKGLDIGGIERIVVDLAIGLGRRGVDAEVAVVNDRRDQLMGQLVDAGRRARRLGGSDYIGLSAARRLARLVRSGEFDVIHVHGPLPAILVRCLPGAPPIVTTSHTVWSGLRWLTRLLWWATAHRDAAALAVSSAVAESLPRSSAARTEIVPHGVDVEALDRAWSTGGGPTRSTATSGVVTAICVASHRDVKNYPNLLHAVAVARSEAPALRLVVVGDGPERERHEQLAVRLGLADAVEFRSATPEVLGAMRAADFLVVASDFEGQPLVVMEAMALALPVVATAVGRVPELLTPSEGRIVPPGDTRALADALVEVALDPELRRSMGERARSASRAWTLDQVIDAHLRVYASVIR